MTTNEKCREILEAVVRLSNSEGHVNFLQDFGGNTLTVGVLGDHTHVGCPGGSFDQLVDNLHAALVGPGVHLSWAGARSGPTG